MRLLLILLPWLLLSGFSFSNTLIPADRILAGGPPKDGIPALTYPAMETSDAANHWLEPDDMVLGVTINGLARAYPVRILNWHEIVNDRIGTRHLVISYCPLCGSGLAFDTADHFGVSGLLYQSDVLLYDKKSESLWSQLMMQAIAGPRSGERLHQLPLEQVSWSAWQSQHPDSSLQTGE